jgi:hypothetical protein
LPVPATGIRKEEEAVVTESSASWLRTPAESCRPADPRKLPIPAVGCNINKIYFGEDEWLMLEYLIHTVKGPDIVLEVFNHQIFYKSI